MAFLVTNCTLKGLCVDLLDFAFIIDYTFMLLLLIHDVYEHGNLLFYVIHYYIPCTFIVFNTDVSHL